MAFKNIEDKKKYHKEYIKAHYEKNKEYYKERVRINKQAKINFIQRVKRLSQCKICNESRWWVLEFHHTDPTKKDGNLGDQAKSWSIKRIKEEIRKCDILCANCHKDIHHRGIV